MEFHDLTAQLPQDIATADRKFRDPESVLEGLRPLSTAEVDLLTSSGNRCDDWSSVRVAAATELGRIRDCDFSGRVIIGAVRALARSSVRDSVVADGATIDAYATVESTFVDVGATIHRATVGHRQPQPGTNHRFGIGTEFIVGSEAGERTLRVDTGLSPQDAFAQATERSAEAAGSAAPKLPASLGPDDTPYPDTYIGPAATIDNATVCGTWIAAEARVADYAIVESSVLLSEPSRAVVVSAGARVRRSVVHCDVEICDGATIERAIVHTQAHVGAGCIVRETVIGSACSIAGGEIHASILGPLVAAHHQSLLIGCLWPGGRGNVGYGANVGSNHTGRVPDQEIRPGEGMFFGLGSSMKFPGNYERAPYTIVASGVVVPPQRLDLPFSLIADDGDGVRVVPAWVLRSNMYGVVRNEQKFARRLAHGDTRVLRPELADTMVQAADLLQQAVEANAFERAAFGVCRLSQADAATAIAEYRRWAHYSRVRQTIADGRRLSLDELETFRSDAQELVLRTVVSRRRDYRRGERVFDDYRVRRVELARDPVVLQLQRDLEQVAATLSLDLKLDELTFDLD